MSVVDCHPQKQILGSVTSLKRKFLCFIYVTALHDRFHTYSQNILFLYIKMHQINNTQFHKKTRCGITVSVTKSSLILRCCSNFLQENKAVKLPWIFVNLPCLNFNLATFIFLIKKGGSPSTSEVASLNFGPGASCWKVGSDLSIPDSLQCRNLTK